MQIVTRDEWGARYRGGFRDAPTPASSLWLHHTVTPAPADDPEDEAATVCAIEQIGQDRFDGGVSYTFLVAPSGRIYEGHGVYREGAHTRGLNTHGRAVCLIGNYDTDRVPEAMADAVAELVAFGHLQDWWPERFTGGHRDAPGSSTACPGRHAHALIPELNRRAELALQNGGSMSWNGPPIPDFYRRGLPPLPNPAVALGWATAHAAHSRDYAVQARDHAARAEQGVSEMNERMTAIERLLQERSA